MSKVIALKAASQCGKSTLSRALAAHYTQRGYKVVETSFSDFVREEIASYRAYNWEGSFAEHIKFKDLVDALGTEFYASDITIEQALALRPASAPSRALQQWWGQDFRRGQDPLYWVKKSIAANIQHILDPDTVLIEGSCRQPNEGAYVHALDGVVLDLAKLPAPTDSEATARSHSVEQVVDSWRGDIEVDMRKYFALSPTHQDRWIKTLAGQIENYNLQEN